MTRSGARTCEAVVAEFAWGAQTCDDTGYAEVRWDGVARTVCREHFGAWERMTTSTCSPLSGPRSGEEQHDTETRT